MSKAGSKTSELQAKPAEKPAMRRVPEWVIFAALLLLSGGMILPNLAGQCLWQDEAETALVAKTVLKYGIPKGYDGLNYLSQDAGKGLGCGYVWRLHPWLQFYVDAASIALFGSTTLAARLPFALFGIATVLLVYLFGNYLWRSRRAGVLAALLLLTNVPFLILARQCRYYAPLMFFFVASIFAYCLVLDGRKRAMWWYAAATVLLFHTHYGAYAALIVAAFIHCVIFARKQLRAVFIASAVSVVLCLPWAVWFAAAASLSAGPKARFKFPLALLQQYLELIGTYIVNFTFAAIIPVAVMAGRLLRRSPWLDAREWKWVALLLMAGVFALGVSCKVAPYPFFRYLAPLLPLAFLLLALVIETGFRAHWVVGLVCLAAVGYTVAVGVTAETPSGTAAVSLSEYGYELTHKFTGPVDGIVAFLKEHAAPGDVVAISYDDLPVKFYTGLRVVGGLTGEDLSLAETARWVIIRQYNVSDRDLYVSQYLSQLPLDTYEQTILDCPDTPFQNREEPSEHYFRTQVENPVTVYRRRG